ncbi:MAG: CDGSH iron-sulfur domain-containing protein [Bacteroidales bacterium]|nr:CDGSH iron-sulfur domain-containing protein [Bacteroidales bacterium]
MVKHKDVPKKSAIIVGKRSIKMEMKAGKYFWCACGRSKKHPFCDGSHHQTGIRPVRVVLEFDQLVKWCACKKTKTPPFCDNTHRELPE